MEPHTIDPAHRLAAPHHEGVFGPLLWIEVPSARVWQEGSPESPSPELGTSLHARLVWVGQLVAVVSAGLADEHLGVIGQALRTFLRHEALPIVFSRGWLPEKVGTVVAADAPNSVPPRELARAEAYALVQTRWFEEERVTIQLAGETFEFEVRSVLDAADRVQVTIR